MSPTPGRYLRIRAMTYVAGKPVPFFWPMRSFIHHNPLHGFEHLPFADAVEKGTKLFHARGFLPRAIYQGYLQDGKVDLNSLNAQVERFIATYTSDKGLIEGVDLNQWLMTLLTDVKARVTRGNTLPGGGEPEVEALISGLSDTLLGDRPVYESVDTLYGTGLTEALNDQVVRACLDFFDEGQSVWVMPDRELGFFSAWRKVAGKQTKALLNDIADAECADGEALTPEMVIDHIMRHMEVPEDHWMGYFTRETAHLHGWAGFIRWRATASHYHWSERYPGDLVDLLAVRLTLAMVLLKQRCKGVLPQCTSDLERLIIEQPHAVYLRKELYSGDVLPVMAQRVEEALGRGKDSDLRALFSDYTHAKHRHEVAKQDAQLRYLATQVGDLPAFEALDQEKAAALRDLLSEFERDEGMIWLRAMEAQSMNELLAGLNLSPGPSQAKRPFVQAAFCIDTRSERIRRHLESVGDYQTFGIAGFFGVPVSMMELGKGSEIHLCPVILTPKNVVLEMSSGRRTDAPAMHSLEHALHELKESVLTPFVTVEAIGLLFGFDMVGKTVAPQAYNRWRRRLHEHKPGTHLLLDKLTEEQADSILRAVQRAVIVEAAGYELSLEPETFGDHLVREVREAALGKTQLNADIIAELGISQTDAASFITKLRETYRINAALTHRQLEELGRIGFTLDEQAGFVQQALSSIGLTNNFSRFVLLTGHGSTSENNPYESALDCGACGGNHGLVSARVLAQMANRPSVRKRLAKQGLQIPEDTWFLPALHNTTTDEISLHDLELLPASHLVYLDRLRTGLTSAARLCAQERLPSLQMVADLQDPASAFKDAQRNSMDWSQVRPEWGLSRNAYFIIGRRDLTHSMGLDGRAFLHSYDHRIDPKLRLLENILTGPLVVGQWINMEHYFSAVDNEHLGSGSKVYHNVAGHFGVMTGNLSDLRTGLPSQTVLKNGLPYHEPTRLITVIEAPFEHAKAAVENIVSVKRLVRNGWIRLLVVDSETNRLFRYEEDGQWLESSLEQTLDTERTQELDTI